MNILDAMPIVNLTEQCKDSCNLGAPTPTTGLITLCGIMILVFFIAMAILYFFPDMLPDEDNR